MKFRAIGPLFALLLAACSLQRNPFPPNLQPVAILPLLTAQAPSSTSTLPPATATKGPAQAATLPANSTKSFAPSPIPPLIPTPSPAPIDIRNAGELRPVAIYPLFRRGLLRAAVWSPDGANIVVDTSQGLQVLSVPDLQKRFSIPDTHPLYFLNDGELLVKQPDKTLAWLNLKDNGVRPLPVQLPEGEGDFAPFAVSPDGSTWVTSPDGVSLLTERLDNRTTQEVKLWTRTGIAFQVEKLVFSSDGKFLYAHVRRIDNETELIAVDTAEWKPAYEAFNASSAPLFSSDGARMLYASKDVLTISLVKDGQNWASLSRRILNRHSATRESILSAQAYSFLPGSNMLGVIYNGQVRDTAEKDSLVFASSLMLYNLDTRQTERFIDDLPMRVIDFSFSPDGSRFLTTSGDGMLRIWETVSGKLVKASEPYDVDANPQIRPDGKLVAYSMADHVDLVDPSSGVLIASLGNYPDADTLDARFAGTDTLAVFVETPWQRYIETWDVDSQEPIQRYPDPGNCSFNRNGSIMACYNGTFLLFDMPSGIPLLNQVPQGSNFEYAISDDGNWAAYCTTGSEAVYVWEIRKGSVAKSILGRQPGVCGHLAFSTDGQKLASSSGFLWDAASEKLLQTFQPSAGEPVAFNPAGDLLLVYPELIDLNTGESLDEMKSVPGVQAAYFQPGGINLVLQTRRGIEFWRVAP